MRLPGGGELQRPSNGELSRALGIGLELGAARRGRPAGHRRRPGRPRRRRLRRLGGPRHAGRREHRARRPGGDLAADRELPRLPGRDQRHRTDQPRDRPGAQVPRPHRDPLPGARRSSRRRGPTTWCKLEERQRGRRAGGAALDRRRIPAPAGRRPRGVRGPQRLLRRRAARGAALRRPAGRRRSAAATRPPRPRSGWPAAAPWSPSCTAAPTSARRCRAT